MGEAGAAAFGATFCFSGRSGGKIHAVGGRDRESVGIHRVYDPATNSWSELAPLPNPRDHMGLVVIGGKLYAVADRLNTFEYNTN